MYGSSEDTEGEIVTIGEEEGIDTQAKIINKKMPKNKASRSPLRPTAKNQLI